MKIPEHLAHLPVVSLPDATPRLASGGDVTDGVIVMPGEGSVSWWKNRETGEVFQVSTGTYAQPPADQH